MTHKHFDLNTLGNDYVVGDIHGCYSMLNNELDKIGFNRNVDRLFCTGDLVDRGGESIEVLDWLSQPWFHSVVGNHDLMAVDYYNALELFSKGSGELPQLFKNNYMLNGGGWFIKLPHSLKEVVINAIKELPITIDIDTHNGLVGIIHAECPIADWEQTKEAVASTDKRLKEIAVWGRTKFKTKSSEVVSGVYRVYNGHNVVEKPIILGNRHYIDTGAVFYGNFTIIKL